ncbi:Protein of unknown function [Cotesia congregata]|uniref:Uncharacterized protein n=1 Tax=Cotesia congregata TaxID=51543 RepID=A0A8J2MMJ7_COTCN|nr:Protein of unknown function [Cotesia congregata]
MIKRYGNSKVLILKSLIKAGANINETSESAGTKLKFLRMVNTYGEINIVVYLVDSFELDFMLVDYEILETVIKLHPTLLSKEQLEDQQFMVKLKRIFMNQLINHARNEDVRALCSRDYADKCPMYSTMIKKRVDTAVKRSKLLEKSSEKIFILLKTLPFQCCQKILTYFDDNPWRFGNIQYSI